MDTDGGGGGVQKQEKEVQKGDVQLCLKFFMQRGTAAEPSSMEMEVQFLDGEVGKDGVHQIIQYIVNKNKGL